MQIDESQLIARSRQGDLDAFNRLVEHYQRPVYNLCLRMLASPQAAEDATQDAFIAAYRAIDRFRGGGFRAWLFRIAANACYDELRRRRSRPALSLDAPAAGQRPLDLPHPGPPLHEHAQRLELARALQQALAALPPDQRLAVILCDVQGLDYAEIARVTGVSLGTVKSRLNRARARLRSLLLAGGELLPARFRPSSEGP
ncbi:MAG: sigma-70 family RNA polymerase sigma factor [Chloroflexi bacterium]|nr:sigma-70 family RNA polymerase sigma factor [Chloroflexota bacterium]